MLIVPARNLTKPIRSCRSSVLVTTSELLQRQPVVYIEEVMGMADTLLFWRQLHIVAIKLAQISIVSTGNNKRGILERNFYHIVEPFRLEDSSFPLGYTNALGSRAIVFVRFLELPESLQVFTGITTAPFAEHLNAQTVHITSKEGPYHISKRIAADGIKILIEVIMTTILTCSNHLVSLIKLIQGKDIYAYAKQERQMPELPDGTMAVGNLGELRVES